MYLGLLNFSLLIVFGLAGLVVTAETPTSSNRSSRPPRPSRFHAAALRVGPRHRRAPRANPWRLGTPGRRVIRRNAANQLVTEFYNVNGLTRVTLLEDEHRAQIQTFRNNIWRFIDNAHATTISEDARGGAVQAWAWYIELSIWSLIAMALSGIWLGITARWNFRWTRISLAAGCAAFVALYWLER